MSIVQRIKDKAKQKNLTIAEIERLSGFGNRTIHRWDQNSPSIDKVLLVANLLQVSISWLITGTEESLPPEYQELINRYSSLSNLDQSKINAFIEIASINVYKDKINISASKKSKHQLQDTSTTYYDTNHTIAVLGYVATGIPFEGISIPLGYIEGEINADYALIAKGTSMEPVIMNNEYIYVKSCSSLSNGDIGIFYIDGDVTCKKFYLDSEFLILKSLNPSFKPFKYSLDERHDFKIQGKVLLTHEQSIRNK